MCNYPEENTNTVHVDGQPCPPLQTGSLADKIAKEIHDNPTTPVDEIVDQCVDELMDKSNVDISLMADEVKKAKAEDQEIEDMNECRARRHIIPDEHQEEGQPLDTRFSAQEEAVIMAEVDKRVTEIASQLQAEYVEKVKKRTDELDKHCEEYLDKKEKKLLEHFEEVSKNHQKYLDDEQNKTLTSYFNTLWSCWNQLPDDVKVKLGGIDYVKENAAKAEQELNAVHLNKELNYNASQLVERIGKAYKETGHITDENLATLATDPNMMTDFILKYVPATERCHFELTLQALKEQHPEMQWNAIAINIDDGTTMNYSGLPNMSDTVMSSNNEKVCTVGDIYQAQLKHYKEANESLKIGRQFEPGKDKWLWELNNAPSTTKQTTPKQEPKKVQKLTSDTIKDLPKSMVDKIVTIQNEYWKHQYHDGLFELNYRFATRYIRIIVNFRSLAGEKGVQFVSITYRNDGLGEIHYDKDFMSEDELLASGKNSQRFYDWLTLVVNSFFNN